MVGASADEVGEGAENQDGAHKQKESENEGREAETIQRDGMHFDG